MMQSRPHDEAAESAGQRPPEPPSELPAIEAPCVQTDTACRCCGYNVRGVPVDRRCPDCGTPVECSTRPDVLYLAQISWLTKLMCGCLILAAGTALGVFRVMLLSALLPPGWLRNATIIGWLDALLLLASGWLLTTPDPRGLDEAQHGRLRRTVRVSVMAAFLLASLDYVVRYPARVLAGFSILDIVDLASQFLATAALFAQFCYLGRLAGRIPSYTVRNQARLMIWGFGLLGGASVVLALIHISVGLLAWVRLAPAQFARPKCGVTSTPES